MAIRRHRPTGFSLLELLIAVTILSIIMGIVYTGFISVADSETLAREEAETLRFRQFLWRHFTIALRSVYIDGSCQEPAFALVSTDEEGAFGPADSLYFCSNEPMGGVRALPGSLKEVVYEIGGGDEESEASLDTLFSEGMLAQNLTIRETPLVLSDPESFDDGSGMDDGGDFFSD